jgi:hypothetical protein
MKHAVDVGNLTFHFVNDDSFLVYDETDFHKKRSNQSNKGMDIVCVSGPETSQAWYLEVKDFRIITQVPKYQNLTDIPATTVKKYVDTRLGISQLISRPEFAPHDKFAAIVFACTHDFITLHLEPHSMDRSYMFPHAVRANIQQKIKTLLYQHSLTAYVNILNAELSAKYSLPWTVTSKT